MTATASTGGEAEGPKGAASSVRPAVASRCLCWCSTARTFERRCRPTLPCATFSKSNRRRRRLEFVGIVTAPVTWEGAAPMGAAADDDAAVEGAVPIGDAADGDKAVEGAAFVEEDAIFVEGADLMGIAADDEGRRRGSGESEDDREAGRSPFPW